MTIPVIELGMGALALFFLSARSVPKGRRVLVLRAGKLLRWRGPGFFFAIPFVDAMVVAPVGEQALDIPVAGPEGGEARLHVNYEIADLDLATAKLTPPLWKFADLVRERVSRIVREETEFVIRDADMRSALLQREELEERMRGYAAGAMAKEGYRLRDVVLAHVQASEATWKRIEGEAALEVARRGPEVALSHEEYEEALDNLEHSDLTEEQKESVRQALKRKLGWEP